MYIHVMLPVNEVQVSGSMELGNFLNTKESEQRVTLFGSCHITFTYNLKNFKTQSRVAVVALSIKFRKSAPTLYKKS